MSAPAELHADTGSAATNWCRASLLAVCDVLVIKALEAVGKRIVRVNRARYRRLGNAPLHTAHTIWLADDDTVAKALRGAWDVVPVLMATHGSDCGVHPARVARVLNRLVHDLVITGTPYQITELAYRFDTRLADNTSVLTAGTPAPTDRH